jgi:hypothetical protein
MGAQIMGLLMSFLKMLLVTCIIVGGLYFVASAFNIVPHRYQPAQLYPATMRDVNMFLVRDASSDSITAGLSRSMHKFLNSADSTHATNDPQQNNAQNDTADPQENFITAPINKAHKGVEEYQKSLDAQKKMLDSINE